MRAMKDSGCYYLGNVPVDWTVAPLKRYFHITKRIAGETGHDVLSITQKGLKIKDITSGEGQIAADYSGYQLVEPGDFAMNHMDLLTGWIDCSDKYGVTSPDYRVFQIDRLDFDKRYFLYFFQTCYNARIFYGFGKGISGMGRWRLPADQFKNMLIPVPAVEEQRRIADFLGPKCAEIDKAITAAEASIAEYEAYKKSIIFQAATKGLDPEAPMKDSGIEWVGRIPSSWDVWPQKRLMRKEKVLCEKWNGENVISLTMNGVIIRDLDNPKGKMPATFDGYQYVEPGDLLLCLFDIDVTPRCVGLVEQYGVTSPAYSRFKVFPGVSARYYNYYLTAIDNQKSYLHLTDSMRHSMVADDFGKIRAAVPPFTEQEQIADYLSRKCRDIDKAIDSKRTIVEELKTYKKSLIYEVVTGKREAE